MRTSGAERTKVTNKRPLGRSNLQSSREFLISPPQRVEKGVVGSIYGPKPLENQSKTPQEQCLKPLNGVQKKGTKEFFNKLVRL